MLVINCMLARGEQRQRYEINTGKVHSVGITGASGCGKTSLIRILAGFEPRAVGRVEVAGRCLQDSQQGVFVSPENRRAGVVCQDSCLFPHLNVLKNISFGNKQANPALLSELISVLELENLLTRKPHLLSGGEQRRVAIARAIYSEPDFLLFDEPLTGIDMRLKKKILDYLRRLQQGGVSLVYVSHISDELNILCETQVCVEQTSISASTSALLECGIS
ncbi:ATP-binding cassette domain-containing protein [Pseudoalteromonas sp. T1lg75]|uniref:ATP-binding cassette domain-containing protein n=1 Tax=Pseudoalteromonas sp. T1lg75 TaxID=2077102 RepID=UPI000CF68743|nr:ATP-binding cassette domain-containing protein [Pseudoalteromonas sp. T1lg75]